MERKIINPIVEVNVKKHIEIKKNVKSQIIPHFTKEEMIEHLVYMNDNRDKILMNFLWRTGLRVSEAIAITKEYIDLRNEEITIKWLKNRKTKYRIIPIHDSLKMILGMFIAHMNNADRIFPISRQRVSQICIKHGFNNPHKIRHSYAINFLRQSESPMAIVELRDLLGHSDIKTTMIYLQVVPMQLKKSIKNISFD